MMPELQRLSCRILHTNIHLQAWQIHVLLPRDATPEVEAQIKAQADAIYNDILAGADFVQMAREKSQDQSNAMRGGELPWVAAGDLVKEIEDAAFSLEVGQVAAPVRSNYGYHIIKVTDRIEAGTTPFVKVKEEIKYFLETKEQMKVLKNLTDGLMKTAKIEYIKEEYKPRKDIQKQVTQEEKK